MSKTIRLHLITPLLALGLAACGGNDKTDSSLSETISQEQAEEAAIVQASMRDWTDDHKANGYPNNVTTTSSN